MLKRTLFQLIVLTGIWTSLLMPFISTAGAQVRTGTVLLHAIDADTGKPIANVAFAIENLLVEDWAVSVGKSGSEGRLQLKMKPRQGYFFSVLSKPKDYKITGLDAVPASIVAGGRVEHRFHLRKRNAKVDFSEILSAPKTRKSGFPFPAARENNINHQSSVNDMPGFEGQPIKFWFYPSKADGVARKRIELAERIYRNGQRVHAALEDELRYFRKAEGKKAGSIKEITDVIIEIGSTEHWVLWCRTKGGMKLKQYGFKVYFNNLDSWDLQVPEYLHPKFGSPADTKRRPRNNKSQRLVPLPTHG